MALQRLRGAAAGGKLNSRQNNNNNNNLSNVAISTSAHRALNDGDDIYMIEESVAIGAEVIATEENKEISSVVANASVAVQRQSSIFPATAATTTTTTKRGGRWFLRHETAKIRGKITIPKVMTKITTQRSDQQEQKQPILEEHVLLPDQPYEDGENQNVEINMQQKEQKDDDGKNKQRPMVNAIKTLRYQMKNQRRILVPWSNNKSSNNNTISHANGKFSPPRFLRHRRRQAAGGAVNKKYQEVSEQRDRQISTIDHSEISDIKSIRSSRLDVVTGKTLMTRQGAQVFTRPTTNIQTKWDISSIVSPKNLLEPPKSQSSPPPPGQTLSSPSSLSSSTNTQSPRQRSITIDNSSCVSGISDVTEETTTITMRPPATSYYNVKKQNRNSNNIQQRLPMFIRSNNDNNLLPRNTFRIDEEEVCSDGDYGDDDEEVIDFTGGTTELFNGSYDFRALDDDVQSIGVQRCPSVSPSSASTQDLSLSKGASNKLGQVLRRNNIREMDVIWDLLVTENAAPVIVTVDDDKTTDIDSRRRFFSDSEIVIERHGREQSNEDDGAEERSQLSPSWTPRRELQDSTTNESVRRRTASDSFFSVSEAMPSDLRSSSRPNRHRTQSDSFLPLQRVDCFEEDSTEFLTPHETKDLSRHESIRNENGRVSPDTNAVVGPKNAIVADDRLPFAEKQLGRIDNSSPLPFHQSSPQSSKYATTYQGLQSTEGKTSTTTAGSYYWSGIDENFQVDNVAPPSPSDSFESYSDIL